MWQRFSPSSRAAILRAQQLAVGKRVFLLSPAHLFVALLDEAHPDSPFGALLRSANLRVEEARVHALSLIGPAPESTPEVEPRLNEGAKQVLLLSSNEARRAGDHLIEPEHLLLGCLRSQPDDALVRELAPLGWNLELLRAERLEACAFSSSRAGQNPLKLLTSDSHGVLDAAYQAMRATFCGRISTAHLLIGLLDTNNFALQNLQQVGVSIDELKAQTRASIRSDEQLATPEKRFDNGAKRALDRARWEAQARGSHSISPDHILLGLLPIRATMRERLTWGLNVKDEASHVLANVDAAKLREMAGPILKKPAKKERQFGAFILGLCLEGFLSFVGFASKFGPPNEAGTATLAIILAVVAFAALVALGRQRDTAKQNGSVVARHLYGGIVVGFLVGCLLGLDVASSWIRD